MVDFYCVFDGCFIRASSSDLFESIKNDILPFYPLLSSKFKLDKQSAKALHILAKNSRKRYSINKQLGHFAASFTMNKLLERGFLQIEKSKEEKIKRKKGQKLKKALRKYTIQDKVLFRNNFLRFFAYFLQPNENLILNKAYDELLAKIKKEFKHYQSLCFEGLGRELLESKFKINSISSFWSNDVEIDLFYKDSKLTVLGEVKFKDKKICKNVFNSLQNKAKILNLKPDYFVIFSKSGFSSELIKNKEANLLLFDFDELKTLLKDTDERKYTKKPRL
ncbi:DUF234 domain protein [Campylobacter avium LMG 24591]|uniref:DUF234 domain protein n=1 Tax=Campylobacter avium LMG 24591 TaxID=522484 RepID=A0A222MX23_9BACT|nr:DUF234 domain-containing protein [Campylobacter avium]ASQ30200.1 DUF234 domain protein [Campylobacter avium LMG 24591]OYD79298.1 hypothetical protein CAV8706_0535 [Campylobacter avium]